MKKLYILLFFPAFCFAQVPTLSENFVKTSVYKDSTTTVDDDKARSQVTYFDGLGRPKQQIIGKASAGGYDIITHIEYDSLGRQVKQYLPYPGSNNNLSYDSGALDATLQHYGATAYEGTLNPYSQTFHEKSPMGTVLKQSAPGNAWTAQPTDNDNTVKFLTVGNVADDYVKKLHAIAGWTEATKVYEISLNATGGFYPAGQLSRTITQNENKASPIYRGALAANKLNTVEEFKNKEGQLILKRTYTEAVENEETVIHTLDTYYVYDQYGNLTYVIPPLAQGVLEPELCYYYKYDSNNRLVEKKLPGKQWEFIVYDSLDRVVATGPAYSPFGSMQLGWLRSYYDKFGRVAFTGWAPHTGFTSTDRATLQALNNAAVTNVARGAGSIDSVGAGYAPPSLPTGFKLLTVYYYDNYTWPNAPVLPINVLGRPVLTNAKSLATGKWVRVLTDPGETLGETSYTIYDIKGRPIRTGGTNHLGGYTFTDSKITWAGQPKYTITKHRRDNTASTEITVKDVFTYTPEDRLQTHTHQVNNEPVTLLAHNEYNALGQLVKKKVGGSDAAGALQHIDYAYTVRGWLKSINDVTNLAIGGTTVPQDLFAFKVNYNEPITHNMNNRVVPQYTGNIAETSWRTAGDNIQRRYGYQYDQVYRLRGAFYQIPQATTPERHSYDEQAEYDRNGNITTLNRNGEYDYDDFFVYQIDKLTYTYDPVKKDRLMKVVDDPVNNSPGFADSDTNTTDDYTYDDFGNMLTDNNKKISSILYNHLNLPTSITVYTNELNDAIQGMSYIYNAEGKKVRKTVTSINTRTGLPIINNTDYLDGFQYVAGVLDFFPTTEGYVKVTPGGTQTYYNYVFNYTDHLGNVRVSYTYDNTEQQTKMLQENHYYPFGLMHGGYAGDQQIILPDPAGPPIITTPPVGITGTYNHKYNGKEYIASHALNLYDYGARNYDPAIGRWMNIDPLAEKMATHTPYHYAFNNPLIFVDAGGLYPIYIVTRSYAPFETFGPSNRWHGDSRGHTLDRSASYRSLVAINHDTETRKTTAFGGKSRSYTTDGKQDALSATLVENRSKGSKIDVHSAGRNEAQTGSFDIDQFTKLDAKIEGNVKKDHILNISGTISGDDFPNQESMIYDSKGNSLWLGNYETTGDRQSGPVTDLPFENEGDVNININIRIKVDSKGIFQGVMVNEKGKDRMISISDWNKRFKSDDNK